jgi:glyoxylase-like metal-dependent hydrolase (beta-lactamase superfamily II)
MDAPNEAFHLQTVPVATPFPFGAANMYLYDGGEALTLFDAAFPTEEAWSALLQALSARGATVRDLRRVVLTHHHFDHTGLVGRVVAESGAEVWGHPEIPLSARLAYSFDEEHSAWMAGLLKRLGTPPDLVAGMLERRPLQKPFVYRVDRVDRALPDGTVFDGFRVVHVPGHSPTDTLFVHESSGFSITGDHVLEHITPNPILRRPPSGGEGVKCLVQFEESLRRCRTLPLGRCFPGHGKPFEDHARVVDKIISRHEERNQRILAWLPGIGATPYETARHLYPRMGTDVLYFCMSVAVGQLELLESQGLLRSSVEEGVTRYFPVAAGEPEQGH